MTPRAVFLRLEAFGLVEAYETRIAAGIVGGFFRVPRNWFAGEQAAGTILVLSDAKRYALALGVFATDTAGKTRPIFGSPSTRTIVYLTNDDRNYPVPEAVLARYRDAVAGL